MSVTRLHQVLLRRGRPVSLVIFALALSGCGGGGTPASSPSPGESASPTTTPAPAGSPEQGPAIRACLRDAGLDLVSGQLPLAGSVDLAEQFNLTAQATYGFGIRLAGGGLRGGAIGVFVYPSEEAADNAKGSLQGASLTDFTLIGTVLVVYAKPAPNDVRAEVEACASGGA